MGDLSCEQPEGTALGLLLQSTTGEETYPCTQLGACLSAGDFAAVLKSPAIRSALLPSPSEQPICCAAEFYDAVHSRAWERTQRAISSGDASTLATLLTAGASCLNVFTQHNLTGPYEPEDPSPLQLLAPHLSHVPATATALTSSTTAPQQQPTSSPADKAEEELVHPHEQLAAEQLITDGEDLVTRKVSHLQYLLLSEALLVGPLLSSAPPPAASAATATPNGSASATQPSEGDASAPSTYQQRMSHSSLSPDACEALCTRAGVTGASWLWWALRVTCMHQHVLAGRSATLLARTNTLTKHLLHASSAPAALTAPVPPSAAAATAAASAVPAPAPGAPKDLSKAAALAAAAKTVPTAAQGSPESGSSTTQPSGPSWQHTLQARPLLHACLLLEMALGQYGYGFVEHGHKLLNEAGTVLGLRVQLSGAMGRRTVHQEDPKAQLVVRASRSRQQPSPGQEGPDVSSFGFGPIYQPQVAAAAAAASKGTNQEGQAAAAAVALARSQGGEGGLQPGEKVQSRQPTEGMVDESDVFMAPQLVGEDGQVLESRYSSAEQALLLAWAMHVKKGSAQDELQQWEMAPYLEAVLSQPRSHMMLQATARLLKARHERSRGRTRERALMHMEQLLEALAAHPPPSGPEPGTAAGSATSQQGSSSAANGPASSSQANAAANGDRVGSGQQASSSGGMGRLTRTHLPYTYGCWFPLRVQLRKELAEHYLSMGFVGAALGIYEELQLWDALVLCYRLLDKKGAAEDLLKRRLKVTPNDPVIWCNLGDLYLDDSYYEEAWKRSGCKHGRSKRSLGRSALRRKDYAASAAHYEEALAINPLNPDAWFSQGYAYLKLRDQRKALRALTNVTQQVPDHAEAWNNVAALWLELGEPKRAFSALSECVRYKRDSWHIWENYAQIAQEAGHPLQAARGLAQVMQLSGGARLHIPVLQGLVQAVEDILRGSDGSTTQGNSNSNTASDAAATEAADAEEGDDDLAGFVLDIPASLGQTPWAGSSGEGAVAEEEDADGRAPASTSKSAYQAGIAAAQQRTNEQVCTAVGKLLKEAVNLPCCTPEVWGLLGRYYGLRGQLEGAKEALLKQVRALSGSAAFKTDETRFVQVADASLALAQAYIQLFRGGSSIAPPPAADVRSRQQGSEQASSRGAPEGQQQHLDSQQVPSSSSAPAPSTAAATAAAATAASSTPLQAQPGSIRELAAARMHLRGVLKQCEPTFGEHPKWQALSDVCAEVTALEAAAKQSTAAGSAQ